jgi:hypothetical protein
MKFAWYAQRLRAMSAGEIVHRVRERLGRRNEAAKLKNISRRAWDGTFADFPKLPWRQQVPPDLRKQLAADAEKLVRGEWELFGWKSVEVGAPPCWHRDATLGVVIDPDTPSRKLDHRHLPHDADARAIWEINRWSEMTRMAMHSALNGDVHAIRVSQLWLEDWCDRNPPGHGINWTSPLEAGLRLMNFCWFDALVRGYYAKRDLPAGAPVQASDFYLAVPLQQGQLSCREHIEGATLERGIKAHAPLTLEHAAESLALDAKAISVIRANASHDSPLLAVTSHIAASNNPG